MLMVMAFALAMIGLAAYFWYLELIHAITACMAVFRVYGPVLGWFHPLKLLAAWGPLMADIIITGSAVSFFRFGEGLSSAVVSIGMSNVLSIFILNWSTVMKNAEEKVGKETDKILGLTT